MLYRLRVSSGPYLWFEAAYMLTSPSMNDVGKDLAGNLLSRIPFRMRVICRRFLLRLATFSSLLASIGKDRLATSSDVQVGGAEFGLSSSPFSLWRCQVQQLQPKLRQSRLEGCKGSVYFPMLGRSASVAELENARLTSIDSLSHSVSGSFLAMFATVRRFSTWGLLKFFGLIVVLTICGAQLSYGQDQSKDQTSQQANEKIRQLAALEQVQPADNPVGSGDLLQIDVFDVPELSREVRVSDTGDITFPLIPGRIPVAGLTPFELQSKLGELLIENGLVTHPQVSVFVKDQVSEPVNVVGAVAHPTVYQVTRPTTLLEVLAAAGGISNNAGSVVIVTRPTQPGQPRTEPASTRDSADEGEKKITIRLQDLLESGNTVYNIPVYGGDTVTVPSAGIVYVLGFGVAQQGGYVLQSYGQQVTILKAIALAHGLTSFAKANSTVIMRDNPVTGRRDVIHVRLKDIEKHKATDVPLKPDDILYVPDSAGKKALARGTQAALGIGTSVTIYRVAY
jgi:polysaccharide biosynthesis/export protein